MKAWELLAEPTAWTKGANARDMIGDSRPPNCLRARSWCVVGALKRIYGEGLEFCMAHEKVAGELRNKEFGHIITHWNDDPATTHEEVIFLLRKANV